MTDWKPNEIRLSKRETLLIKYSAPKSTINKEAPNQQDAQMFVTLKAR